MTTATQNHSSSLLEEWTLNVEQAIQIDATIDEAYSGLLHRMTDGSMRPNNEPMPMRLEPWPGGRWFRDLGDDQGHLWGFVQVIKPPRLVEIQGPMFMSYPAAGHIQFRLEERGSGVELSLHHRALGMIEPMHREGVIEGWQAFLHAVKQRSEA